MSLLNRKGKWVISTAQQIFVESSFASNEHFLYEFVMRLWLSSKQHTEQDWIVRRPSKKGGLFSREAKKSSADHWPIANHVMSDIWDQIPSVSLRFTWHIPEDINSHWHCRWYKGSCKNSVVFSSLSFWYWTLATTNTKLTFQHQGKLTFSTYQHWRKKTTPKKYCFSS